MIFIRNPSVRYILPFLVVLLFASSCAPKQPIQFRTIKNISVEMDSTGEPLLKGEAILFNPNRLRMKLKEVKMEVLVDGKKAALVDQKPNLKIPAAAEFPVYVEAHLAMKDLGLVDAMLSLFGGKKYEVQYVGYVRVRVHGVTVKVPVRFTDHLKLK